MGSTLEREYDEFTQYVAPCKNMTAKYVSHLWASIYESDRENLYGKPMPWIGIYIALASLLCVIAMVADLLHGLHNRKLWFPCKYFTLNAASLTVIAVTIKLPMDVTNLMPGFVDQITKLGSVTFLCTMLANLLPSVATMDATELVSNMIALGILVITLVVNLCIQISTGVLSYLGDEDKVLRELLETGDLLIGTYVSGEGLVATVCVGMLLLLLMIYACSSLAILKSKQILESKYQAAHLKALLDQELQQTGRLLPVEKLKQMVCNYWIMAGTGSPQFMTICFVTTSASGVICVISALTYIYIMPKNYKYLKDYKSDYKWTILMVLVIQCIGVMLGTIVPLSRCFAALNFKLSPKWIWNHIKVFKVESYWTQKLYDWKLRIIPFVKASRSRKWKIVIENLKILFLNICIGFQKTVVVACKMIAVIPLLFVIRVSYCCCFWKWLKSMFYASSIVLVIVQNHEHLEEDSDVRKYVLQLQDTEFAQRTLRHMSKSVNRLIQKAEKQQP